MNKDKLPLNLLKIAASAIFVSGCNVSSTSNEPGNSRPNSLVSQHHDWSVFCDNLGCWIKQKFNGFDIGRKAEFSLSISVSRDERLVSFSKNRGGFHRIDHILMQTNYRGNDFRSYSVSTLNGGEIIPRNKTISNSLSSSLYRLSNEGGSAVFTLITNGYSNDSLPISLKGYSSALRDAYGMSNIPFIEKEILSDELAQGSENGPRPVSNPVADERIISNCTASALNNLTTRLAGTSLGQGTKGNARKIVRVMNELIPVYENFQARCNVNLSSEISFMKQARDGAQRQISAL